MAGRPSPRGLILATTITTLAWLDGGCVPARAQTKLTLEQAVTRRVPEYVAVHLDQHVIVTGTVTTPAYHFRDYTVAGIEQGKQGAVLRVGPAWTTLDKLRPGDVVEVDGTVTQPAGMVSIEPLEIKILQHEAAPQPVDAKAEDLNSFKLLGRLVRLEAPVYLTDKTPSGTVVMVGNHADGYRVFIPYPAKGAKETLGELEQGDKIVATGLAHQFCKEAPYDRKFELLVGGPDSITAISKRWVISPATLVLAVALVLLASALVWGRERWLREQREKLRKTYQVGEEILASSSVQMILKRLRESLPQLLGISRVRLYVYNRSSKTLDAVSEENEAVESISLSSPPEGAQSGAVACFHYRTLLAIPDIERSPFPITRRDGAPRSLLFVPMLSQGEVIGVLELDQDDKTRDFSSEEQELAQHLGNQIGVAVRVLDQRSVREQLFRTEKLAAVGRLISGVVNELQSPLASISDLARLALERAHLGPAEREVAAIASEAQKAAGMVARLVSYAAAEQGEARPVSVTGLLSTLLEFREGDWKASGIRVRDLVSREPLFVLGAQGQLEQVLLNLLVHAEQSLASAPDKLITVRTSAFGKRLLVEIVFSALPGSRKAEETAAVLGVTRSVIAGHGGEVRLIEKSGEDPRFEVDLPLTVKERVVAANTNGRVFDDSRRMTALVIEPDETSQRQILALLSTRGFRVVPVNNSDTALELAHRLRFEAAFCSVHAPGLNWVELSERMHQRVGSFILLSDGYNTELATDFEGEGRYVLAKPVQESELDRVLHHIAALAPAS
jgi:GAF domain-containing protein